MASMYFPKIYKIGRHLENQPDRGYFDKWPVIDKQGHNNIRIFVLYCNLGMSR